MLEKIFKLFRKSALSNVPSSFIYQDSFNRLPNKFFTETARFFEEVNRPNLAGNWSHHQISPQYSVCVMHFLPTTIQDSMSRAIMISAVYDARSKRPHKFYVLLQSPIRLIIREVNNEGTSWAIDEECSPEISSFLEVIKSKLS